ncbi:MAG TPA: glycosyltransferase 87 family protein [Pilimelia sp.]|nr:glycosyltransferase 87 family protein [Pilimelia sp.]
MTVQPSATDDRTESGEPAGVAAGQRPSTDVDPVDHPGRSDWFVRGLAELGGGPLGDHAVAREHARALWSRRFWSAARIVLALTCLSLVLHYIQKSPCADGAWTDNLQYTRFCYSDVLALYYAEGLDRGQVPYLDHPVEYPVLTGVFMGILGLPVYHLAQRYPEINQGQWAYHLNALVLCILAVATVAMILSVRRRRPWDAALFALSPALIVTATVNWDFLAIALAMGGLWAWARRRPVLAGVLLGLGTAAKLWPGFLFIPLLFLALRARRLRPVLASVGVGIAACVAVNLPFMVLNYENWDRFIELNRERGVDWGTFWYIGNKLPLGGGEYGIYPFTWLANNIPVLNPVTYILIILGWFGVGVLALSTKRRPRVAQLAFLVVAIFLIFNKVWSQQFVLWLLPLVVLARPRWGAFLAWQFAEVGYFVAFYGELLGVTTGKAVFPEWVFVLASTLRLGTVVALCVFVIRDMVRAEDDPVRQTYPEGDPDGGVLNDHPDGPGPDGDGPDRARGPAGREGADRPQLAAAAGRGG